MDWGTRELGESKVTLKFLVFLFLRKDPLKEEGVWGETEESSLGIIYLFSPRLFRTPSTSFVEKLSLWVVSERAVANTILACLREPWALQATLPNWMGESLQREPGNSLGD